KYRVKKTKNNRALIGYGMGVCSALLYTFSIPFLFGSISYHLTECALVCPAIIEQTMHTKSLEQAKNRLSLRTFNIMNGPASFLFAAFEISQYTKILRDHLNRTPINSSIDQLIIESIDRDQLLQKGALQIKEMLQKKHIDPILLNTVINTNSLKKNFSCSLVPLFILWPSIKKAINTLPDTLEYNGFILQKEAAIALLSIGVDPTDYINQNSHFILAAEKNGIKADEIFADVPSAVLRLMVHSQHFSIEPDDEQERFKEALILHGLYFLNA
ncbi:MAG TPA: hypothetical protein VL201_00030, partial [Patescibacteria group bacterium]|nr:hypothetical protein [Patescibacteria group bacterium]